MVLWKDRRIVERGIMRKMALTISLVLISVCIAGCESSLFQTLFQEQEWSDNYALDDGVTCTAMEMIDGDINTAGKTVFPEAVQGRTIYGGFPSAEAEVTLTEKKSIHKIVIRSVELESFEILSSTGTDEWKLIKEFDNNKEKEMVIKTSIITDKIKIRARGNRSPGEIERGAGRGRLTRTNTISEPEIQEIELYGFK